jgi:hypothetical protein
VLLVTVLTAAVLTGDDAALDVIARRPIRQWDTTGAGICHGTAGVLLTARTHHRTGLCRKAADAAQAQLPAAGHTAFADPGLLTGFAGTALALSGPDHQCREVSWTAVLLLTWTPRRRRVVAAPAAWAVRPTCHGDSGRMSDCRASQHEGSGMPNPSPNPSPAAGNPAGRAGARPGAAGRADTPRSGPADGHRADEHWEAHSLERWREILTPASFARVSRCMRARREGAQYLCDGDRAAVPSRAAGGGRP